MSGGADAPAPRDLYTETAGELKAKADLAPKMYDAESRFRPMYDNLDLKSMDEMLNGTSAHDEDSWVNTKQEWSPEEYKAAYLDRFGKTPSANGVPVGGGRQTPTPAIPANVSLDQMKQALGTRYNMVKTKQTTNVPGQKGLIDLSNDMWVKQRQGAINALNQGDPEEAALMSKLTGDATSDLNRGADMDPGLSRIVQQSIRARQGGTLLENGDAGAYDEALGMSEFGNDLRNQRRANAANMVQMREGLYSGTMNNSGATQQAYGMTSAAGPRMFGSTVNANDVANSNFNADAAAKISTANNNAANLSAGVGAVGMVAGTAILVA